MEHEKLVLAELLILRSLLQKDIVETVGSMDDYTKDEELDFVKGLIIANRGTVSKLSRMIRKAKQEKKGENNVT